jgi:hypothetical protein
MSPSESSLKHQSRGEWTRPVILIFSLSPSTAFQYMFKDSNERSDVRSNQHNEQTGFVGWDKGSARTCSQNVNAALEVKASSTLPEESSVKTDLHAMQAQTKAVVKLGVQTLSSSPTSARSQNLQVPVTSTFSRSLYISVAPFSS